MMKKSGEVKMAGTAKIALALICKGSDLEADALYEFISRAVNYRAKGAFDEAFITVTQKNKRVMEVLEWGKTLFPIHVSEFEWCNDFAKARNFNFSQVPKDFTHIFWMDVDDGMRGEEMVRGTIESKPEVDAFSFYYLYDFDENKNPTVVHQKTRVLKNDGCVSWEGALHEDFKENREVMRMFVKGPEILHLTTKERVHIAGERNLEVARKMAEDKPDDPRSFWNLGNSMVAVGKYEEALEQFKKFQESSQSEEERYIIHLRLAEVYSRLGDNLKAIDSVRYAIGMRPEYPDAFHLAGQIYYNMGQYQKAQESYLQGLLKKPPYYSIVVFNPRDYDYHPMMALAKTYFALNQPIQALVMLKGCKKISPSKNLDDMIKLMEKEAKRMEKVLVYASKLLKIKDKRNLRRALDKVPAEFQDHPMLCNIRNVNFVKTESSGKDLVFVCGYTSLTWNPDIARDKGIGGSEEAVIHLSELLAQKGWNVTVYCNCGHQEKKYGNVTYRPFWAWNYRDKQDLVILWRSFGALKYEINAPKIYLDLHDVVSPGEFSEERLKKIQRIFVKSKFHRDLFPEVPDDKFAIIPNGIVPEVFDQELERDQYLMINTSSPDRSLNGLLDLFAEVKKRVPEAKLKWGYGWGVFDIDAGNEPARLKLKTDILKKIAETPGVEDLGRVSHVEVAKLYLQANVFAYPSEFAEIDCISLTKALAGGAIPVTTDFAAMGEKAGHGGYFIHSEKTKDTWCKPYQIDFSMEKGREEWIEAVVKVLQNPPPEEHRQVMRRWAKQTYSWEGVANQWNEILNN